VRCGTAISQRRPRSSCNLCAFSTRKCGAHETCHNLCRLGRLPWRSPGWFSPAPTFWQLVRRGMVCWSHACALRGVGISSASWMLWTLVLLLISNRGTTERGSALLVAVGIGVWPFPLLEVYKPNRRFRYLSQVVERPMVVSGFVAN
jgi:hypothetical protein